MMIEFFFWKEDTILCLLRLLFENISNLSASRSMAISFSFYATKLEEGYLSSSCSYTMTQAQNRGVMIAFFTTTLNATAL